MKNLLTRVALPVVCAALIPVTALAQNGNVSGGFTVSYTSGVVGSPPVCDPSNSVYVEAHGIGNSTGALGTMFLTIRKCYNYLAGTYTGSFALSSPDARDTMTGTYAGSDDAYAGPFPAIFFPFHGVLTVTAGTGTFKGASGSLNFTAVAAVSDAASGIAYYAIEGAGHN